MDELTLTLDLELNAAMKIKGWPLSHFLDKRYTRKSKKTVIDLQNDYIILDVKLNGFNDLPETLFPPERFVTCNCEELTTGQLIEDSRCQKLTYPKNCYIVPGPIPITVMLQNDFFELDIVDNMT